MTSPFILSISTDSILLFLVLLFFSHATFFFFPYNKTFAACNFNRNSCIPRPSPWPTAGSKNNHSIQHTSTHKAILKILLKNGTYPLNPFYHNSQITHAAPAQIRQQNNHQLSNISLSLCCVLVKCRNF